MADLFAFQDGNFSDAGVASPWKLLETTSKSLTTAGITGVTTAYQASASFTLGVQIIEGIALILNTRAASPTGTMDVQLWNATDSTQLGLVTCNVSDIVDTANGFIYFKFTTPVVSLAAKSYQVRVRTSAASQVNLYRSATGADWSRFLVTSTQQTLVSGDGMFIFGSVNGAGSRTTRTMTNDLNFTSAYTYLVMGQDAVVNTKTNANTEMRLNTEFIASSATCFALWSNAIYNQGSLGNPIQAGFTSTIRIDAATAASMGAQGWATAVWNRYGQTKTPFTTLSANSAVAATSCSLNTTPTGWNVGDQVAITAANRATSQVELRTLNTVGSTITYTGGNSFLHHGSAGVTTASGYQPGTVACHVANLTRNCIFRGGATPSTTNATFIIMNNSFALRWRDCEAEGMGSSVRSITFSSASIIDVDECVFKNSANSGASCFISNTTTFTGAISITNSVFYNINTAPFVLTATSFTTATGTMVFNDNAVITQIATNGYGISSPAYPVECQRNVFTDCRTTSFYALSLAGSANISFFQSQPIRDNIIYSCVTGANVNCVDNLDTGNLCDGNVVFRCTSAGWVLSGVRNSSISNLKSFGNVQYNVYLAYGAAADNLGFICDTWTLSGESGFASQYGLGLSTTANINAQSTVAGRFINCDIGVATGSATQHTIGDIGFATTDTTSLQFCYLEFDNCNTGSTVPLFSQTRMARNSYIAFRNFGKVADAHRTYYREGITSIDTTITKSTTRSLRYTPSSASPKSKICNFSAAIKAGRSMTVSIWVRKSVVGDGAAYNGANPRLIVRRNQSLGITSDTVLATASGAAGTWEQITGTTATATQDGVLSFYVDCDGTAGWINLDDVKTNGVKDTTKFSYWDMGSPYLMNSGNANGMFMLLSWGA